MPVLCQTSDSFCISRRFLRGAGASVRHPGHVRLPSIGRSAPCRLSGGGFSDCVLRREFLLLHGTRLPADCLSPGKFGDVIRPRFSEKFKIRVPASKQKSGAYCCGFGQSRGVDRRSCGFEPRAGRRKAQLLGVSSVTRIRAGPCFRRRAGRCRKKSVRPESARTLET